MPPLWTRALAALGAASLLSQIAPPHSLTWLHWVAYLPMFWAIRADTPRHNRWLAFLYGTVGVGLIFTWLIHTITVFSPSIPYAGAVGVWVLFSIVFGLPFLVLWPLVHPIRRRLGVWWVLVFPALQVVLDWGQMYLFLFPYSQGVAHYRAPWLWQIVSITGVWGVTYLVFVVNTALAEAMYRRAEGRPFPTVAVAGAAGAVAAVLLFGAWRFDRIEQGLRDGESIRLAQLQSDIGMEARLTQSARAGWEEWVEMTRAVPDDVDLIVWPEGACPFNLNEAPRISDEPRKILAQLAVRKDAELVVGGGKRVRKEDPQGKVRTRVFNTVFHFDRAGRVTGHYDKIVPVPFGEYLPFGEHFPGLGHALGIGNFQAGETPVVFDSAHGRIAAPICYEAILPWLCRSFPDPDLFITVTNDAWYGDTANPHQHAMLAAIRATELGVPLVRTAYTGVSLVVEPHGVIHSETAPFSRVSRVTEVRMGTFPTIYARFGDWFVGLCALLLLGAAVRVSAARR